MLKKLCLDTSIISAYFDARKPERQKITQKWWDEVLFEKFQVFLPRTAIVELRATTAVELRKEFVRLIEKVPILELSEEARVLARAYLDEGIFPEKYRNDALCVATAVVENMDVMASWNYGHLVNVDTKTSINGVNLLMGYKEIIIESPMELGGA